MVLEMFEQDWVAIEAMRGRTQDITIIFMDSASENEENHADDVADLVQKLDYLEQTLQEETPSGVDVGGIEINDRLITDQVNITTRASLTGSETVDEVIEHTEAEHWWVSEEHLDATDNSGDFYDVSQGAVKRRALGKALHYKALANGGREYRDSMYTAAEESNIAVFTGLGGGTGSGTFIDVARMIRDRNQSANIELFTTLPTSGQRDQAQANAFAALSELEYQSLNGETIFNDMYLFPLEPTELRSETTESPELREFDQAMSYAIVGAYNNADRDFAFANTSSYSPFTVVVPQVLRYNRDEIKRKKEEIHALLDTKREILNLEYYHFEAVTEYISEFYPNARSVSGSDLSDDARQYIIDRLREFERLITSDLLEKLEIEITDYSTQLLEDIYGDELDPEVDTLTEVIQRRGIDDIIGDIEFTIERRDISGGRVDNYAEFGDEYVRDIVHTEIYRLKESFDTLCRLRGAEKEAIDSSGAEVATDADTKLLETMLVPSFERGAEKKRWRSLDTAKENTQQERDQTIEDLESTIKDLEAEREEFEQATEEYSAEFWSNAEPIIADLITLQEMNVDKVVREFVSELEQYAESVSNEEDLTAIRDSDVTTALEQFKKELDESLDSDVGQSEGIDISNLEEEVSESLDIVKTLRRRWDELESESSSSGLLNRVLGSNGDGTVESDRYRTPYQQLNQYALFEAPRPPNQQTTLERTEFTVTVERDLETEVTQQIDQLRSELWRELRDQYEDLLSRLPESDSQTTSSGIAGSNGTSSQELTDEFDTLVTNTSPQKLESEIRELVHRTVESEITTDIDQYEREIEELKEKRDSLSQKYDRLDQAHDVYEELTGRAETPLRELYQRYQDDFSDEIFDIPHQRSTRHAIENLYKHQVTPADLSSAVKRPSLAETDLLETRSDGEVSQERQDIRKSFKRIVSNRVLDNQYNGLERERLRTADVPTYQDTGVYVAYASEALDESSRTSGKLNPNDFEEIQESLEENFHIDEPANQYDEWFIQNGDPWEVSMCVYIQGISFLDNLRDVIAMDGYWSKYQALTKQRNEAQTIERHAYGLERGFYPIRTELVDINGNTEFFLEESSDIIRSGLQDRYDRIRIDAFDEQPEEPTLETGPEEEV
ncbi:tubulin-like doman-containing protein [Natrialbaceae archaeon GCM10025896]